MKTAWKPGVVRGRVRRVWAGVGVAAAISSVAAARAQEVAPVPPPRPPDIELVHRAPEPTAPPLEIAGLSLPKGRDVYFPMASAEAVAQGLPPEVADAVMRVESGYDPAALGGVGERGLMQVLPSTAGMLGFRGTLDELADPATNIRIGVRYLAGAWKLAAGDLCRTLMKYRAGHNEQRMSALSVEYCRRAKTHLAGIGSPLAAGPLPPVEFGALPTASASTATAAVSPAGPGGLRLTKVAGRWTRTPLRASRTPRAFWAAHTARVKAIEARLPWRRGGIMAGG